MSIFLSCGEVSGDILLSSLTGALRKSGYSRPLWGMVGERGVASGVEPLWKSSELHIMGVSEALAALPRLYKLADRIVREVCRRKPEAVVVVDSPDFHIPMVRRLRKSGYLGPVVYLSPPTVWAWRKRRVIHLRELFDLNLPLFEFEHSHLVRNGVSSAWIGHPMVDTFPPPVAPSEPDSVALLPGSRGSEIRRLMPILVPLARRLEDLGMKPVFSLAPGLSRSSRDSVLEEIGNFELYRGEARELLGRCGMAAGASGTVAVEAMMSDRFMTVLYRAGSLEWFIYDNFVRLPFVSIPNVMVRRKVYPELLQERCNSSEILSSLVSYRSDRSIRCRVHGDLERCRSMMGSTGAADFWAERISRL
ncbi:MAG: lipid-A-disaccharide synthase [Synergistota bacterium]|nr:lipid-A-disaccharide synthase [Synergistota bacterium]